MPAKMHLGLRNTSELANPSDKKMHGLSLGMQRTIRTKKGENKNVLEGRRYVKAM